MLSTMETLPLQALALGMSVLTAEAQTRTQTEIIEEAVRKALDKPTDALTDED